MRVLTLFLDLNTQKRVAGRRQIVRDPFRSNKSNNLYYNSKRLQLHKSILSCPFCVHAIIAHMHLISDNVKRQVVFRTEFHCFIIIVICHIVHLESTALSQCIVLMSVLPESNAIINEKDL